MSGCDVERLEALIAGTLSGARAAETRAHLAACARCGEEMRWLREERRLFRARALGRSGGAALVPGAPPFAAVLAEARRSPRSAGVAERARRFQRAPFLGLAAAAAVALLVASRRDPAPVEVVAEPPPSFACYDDPRSLVAEATAYATDRAIASAEDLYAACLVATPRAACALPSDSDVTCGPLRPSDDEVFESRIRGGSLQ